MAELSNRGPGHFSFVSKGCFLVGDFADIEVLEEQFAAVMLKLNLILTRNGDY